jgi:hypothetical protein
MSSAEGHVVHTIGLAGFGLFLAVYPLFRIGRGIAGHWIALAPARFVVWNWAWTLTFRWVVVLPAYS